MLSKIKSFDSNWKMVSILFLLGLSLRLVVFGGEHQEGDELIYQTLVEQLNSGKGYTLQGSPLLEELKRLEHQAYSRTLFFHPPGGIGLFWLFYWLFGPLGYPLIQIFSYVLFFLSMMWLAKLLGLSSNVGLVITGALSAFTPIMAQVTTHYWLDGPLLGFSTIAAAVFLSAVNKDNIRLACLSGVLLGFASLIKLTAFLIVPGVVFLAWTFWDPSKRNPFIYLCVCLIVPALLAQIPWEIWQWIKLGAPFSVLPENPSDTLIENNKYIYHLTVVRSPWIYLTLTPRILWTLVPTILLFGFLYDNKKIRQQGQSLFLWIFIVLFFHIVLGFLGYSKVIRYIILITPALIIWFSLLMDEAARRARPLKPLSLRNGSLVILITVSYMALILEISTGIIGPTFFKNYDLIVPILGNY